jgi:gas vesicle protein
MMIQREEEHYVTASLISFLAGSIVGAGIALLFAPQSGEYTRREMRERAERAIIKLHRMEDEIKEAMNETLHSIRLKTSQLVDESKDAADLKKREIVAAIAAGKTALDRERRQREKAEHNA